MKTETGFWLDKPQMMGLRGWSLLIPAIASSVGFFCFAVLAYSFTELATLPQTFRTALVLGGAFCLAFGSEIGTLSNIVEVYRKGETLKRWDKATLIISIMSTCGAFVLSFAELLGVNASWGSMVKSYGPIVLGLLAGLDGYTGFAEFGLYLNTFDRRMKQYQTQFEQWKKEQIEYQVNTSRRINEHRVNTALQQETGEKVSLTESIEQPKADIETARSVKQNNDALAQGQRFEQILTAFRDNPKASVTGLANTLGVSRNTVYRDIEQLTNTGKVHKNGQGYIVTM